MCFGPGWKPPVILSVHSLAFTDFSTAPDMYVALPAFATGVLHGGRGMTDRLLVSKSKEQNSCLRYKNYEAHIVKRSEVILIIQWLLHRQQDV
jgi:hypothetical protein